MSNENNNVEEADFKDFADVSEDLELDVDFSQMSEDDVEKALQNIASQMSSSSEFDNIDTPQETEEKIAEKSDIETIEETSDTPDTIPEESVVTEATAQSENEADETQINSEIQPEVQTEQTEQKEAEVSDKDEQTVAEIEKSCDETETKDDTDEADKADDDKTVPESDIELSQWEELNDSNDVVKKYIVYISKDFVPFIDNLSVDARSAYINDAIQQKLDIQDEEKQKQIRRSAVINFVIAVIVIIAITPLGLMFANKAIMATFENYKYSQDNFEKLYKQRFEQDKAYMRSVQYNQEYEKRIKNANDQN